MIGRVVDADGNTLASGSLKPDGSTFQEPGWLIVRSGQAARVIYEGGRQIGWSRQLTVGNWVVPPAPLRSV